VCAKILLLFFFFYCKSALILGAQTSEGDGKRSQAVLWDRTGGSAEDDIPPAAKDGNFVVQHWEGTFKEMFPDLALGKHFWRLGFVTYLSIF
jgi:hypothetical protein